MKNGLTNFSIIIGIIGIILLSLNFLSIIISPKANPSTLLETCRTVLYQTTLSLPLPLGLLFGFFIEGAFLIFIPLSFIGIYLGWKRWRYDKQNLAILVIFLNSFNLCFSFFIAFLLFFLARGI